MQGFFYRASFYLYEISFIIFGFAMMYAGWALRKINQSMSHPPIWIGPVIGGFLLSICALNHFVVYHFLSPQYMISQSQDLLIMMYIFKTISMASVLVAGSCLVLSYYWYWKKITQK